MKNELIHKRTEESIIEVYKYGSFRVRVSYLNFYCHRYIHLYHESQKEEMFVNDLYGEDEETVLEYIKENIDDWCDDYTIHYIEKERRYE